MLQVNSNKQNLRDLARPLLVLAIKLTLSLSLGLAVRLSYAEQYFDPAFLTDGHSSVKVSDLSHFEHSGFQLPGVYRVEISVNDTYIATRDISFYSVTSAEKKDQLAPCIDLATLEQYGVQSQLYPELAKSQQSCIPFTEIIDGAQYDFDFIKQKLSLSFPQAALSNRVKGYIPPEQWDQGINAMFLNYNFSGSNDSLNHNNYFLSVGAGLNLGPWQLRHSSSINYNQDHPYKNVQFSHLNTYVQRPLVGLKSHLVIGNNSSNNEVFDSLSFRGVRLYSSDEMIPDSQQGYAPTIRGVAKTNARIVVQQNGYTVYQTYVSPGPFVLDDLHATSSSGDYQVKVEEADGSVQQYTLPYSTLPILQREGRTKYDVIVGEYRSGKPNQANPYFGQFTAIYGMQNGLTVYAGSQLAEKYQSGLIGIGSNLGHWGAFSVDVTQAKSELADGSSHLGQSYRFLYAKSMLSSGTTFRLLGYRYSTRGFYSLSDVAYNDMQGTTTGIITDIADNKIPVITDYYNLYQTKRGNIQANISHNFGDYGTFYLSAYQQDYWESSNKDKWIQAGYATNHKGVNYSLSFSKNQTRGLNKDDYLLSLNVSFPLSNLIRTAKQNHKLVERAQLSLSSVYNANGPDAYMASLSGTLLDDNNLSYNLSQSYVPDRGNAGSLSLAYQGRYANTGIGYNYNQRHRQLNYSASGGVLLHADGVTFGQNIDDTIILIKAPGAKGVSLENYPGVKTDWRGYTFLPYAVNYRYNRVALNPESYADDLEIKNNVQYAIPMRGAIVRTTFNPMVGIRALIKFKHPSKSIPFGSIVTELNTQNTSMIDDEERAYVTGLPLRGSLKVQWGTGVGDQCTTHYDLSAHPLNAVLTQVELTCK